jgi:hypothetical protein
MPTVFFSGRQKQSERAVSVSLERAPVVLADVRKALPQLKKELSKHWRVQWVDIENQIPRVKNPHDPTNIIKAACIVLTVKFGLEAVGSAGKEFGNIAAKEISKHVRLWLKRFAKQKTRRRKS